jgi:hypothetical protein
MEDMTGEPVGLRIFLVVTSLPFLLSNDSSSLPEAWNVFRVTFSD